MSGEKVRRRKQIHPITFTTPCSHSQLPMINDIQCLLNLPLASKQKIKDAFIT